MYLSIAAFMGASFGVTEVRIPLSERHGFSAAAGNPPAFSSHQAETFFRQTSSSAAVGPSGGLSRPCAASMQRLLQFVVVEKHADFSVRLPFSNVDINMGVAAHEETRLQLRPFHAELLPGQSRQPFERFTADPAELEQESEQVGRCPP